MTAKAFPKGPESLAKHLKIPVVTASLHGIDGWCVKSSKRAVIRVSSNSSAWRQRFTLAHELAHLILGTAPDVTARPFQSNNTEEREADRLASELLIPNEQLHILIGNSLPIDAKRLTRLAKVANVSPVMAACRVVSSTEELGLQNAAVVYLVNDAESWRYSEGLKFTSDAAVALGQQAAASGGKPVRIKSGGKVVVGSVIDGGNYQVLLAQLLPPDVATQETQEEKISRLQKKLFGDDSSFRGQIAAYLGVIKQKCTGVSLEQAVKEFNKRYGTRLKGEAAKNMSSAAGQEFIRLHLGKWFK